MHFHAYEMILKFFSAVIPAVALLLLSSCGGRTGATATPDSGREIEMRHARNISMSELDDGVTLVSLRNPWDTTRNMARYALVEKGHDAPGTLPEGTLVINIPLERSVVYSAVHVALLDELGAGAAVNGVCDAAFINDTTVKAALKAGRIADCGSNQTPNIELIVSLRPEAILLSPYEQTDEVARYARTGINVVQTAEYMEATPLARAEWLRFFGRLYGRAEKADSLFEAVESNYLQLRLAAARSDRRPTVIFDRIYSGTWDVPTSNSVTGRFIEDAGGANPFASYTQSGSARLAPEEVFYKGKDADIWLVRHYEPSMTLSALGKENKMYPRFKAYAEGNVFGANTVEVPIFEDAAFHPDRILREMIRILHPDIERTPTVYYKKLN